MSRRILQVLTAILGLIPFVTGMLAMTGVDDPVYASLGMPRSPVGPPPTISEEAFRSSGARGRMTSAAQADAEIDLARK
jgi:hypothetical protein